MNSSPAEDTNVSPSAYSPELNPIEQFWAVTKSKIKRCAPLNEENLTSRIIEAFHASIILNRRSNQRRLCFVVHLCCFH
jgi:transposase